MRRRHLARGAGRPRARGDAGEVEGDHQGRRFDAGDGEADGVWKPRGGFAENNDVRRDAPHRIGEAISKREEPRPFLGQRSEAGARGGAEAGDRRHILRARADAAFLTPAPQ